MKLINNPGILEKLKMDERIIEEGDIGYSVHVILAGTIKKIHISESNSSLYKSEGFTIAELQAVSIFG